MKKIPEAIIVRHVLGLAAAFALVANTAFAEAPALYSLGHETTPTSLAAQRVDRIVLHTAPLEASAATLALPLPDGQIAYARRDSVEQRGSESLTWRGMVDDGGRVTLTLRNGIVAGRAEMPDGPYEIATSPAGPLLVKLAMNGFPSCGNTLPESNTLPTAFQPALPGLGLDRIDGDPADQIEVMILYTPLARDGAGGVAQIEATAQAAVDVANTAFADSNMTPRFSLVHTELIDYQATGFIINDRNFLMFDPGTAALRNQQQADMVSMFIESGDRCGVAFSMGAGDDPAAVAAAFGPFAFQVTVRDCAVGSFTYAHEQGHLLGFQHNPGNGPLPENALFAHAFAHQATGVARTVMSTESECCDRVGQFSNPDVDFLPPAAVGHPTGIVDSRDNARVGDFVAPFAANWRSRSAIFADGFESMDVSAWSATVP